MARIVKTTSLYTLIVNPDNSFEIKIDGESTRNGTLHEDFAPSVNPEKEIDDPNDTKPEDWVDTKRIPDPEATKPEDWDEDAPYELPDEDAEKPDGWLDDEPLTVPDPGMTTSFQVLFGKLTMICRRRKARGMGRRRGW